MARNAPYYSPRDSPRGAGGNGGGGGGGGGAGGGALRGSARNSPPKESSLPRMHGCGGSPGGVSRSPSPRTSPLGGDAARFSLAPPPQNASHAYSESSSAEASPHHSPASLRKPCSTNFNEGGKPKSPTFGSASVPLERTLSHYQAPPPQSMPGHAPSSSPPPAVGGSTNSVIVLPPQAPTSSPEPVPSGSQSPPHTLDFEDGRVLSQLPYEYSSFLDLPPSALG